MEQRLTICIRCLWQAMPHARAKMHSEELCHDKEALHGCMTAGTDAGLT